VKPCRIIAVWPVSAEQRLLDLLSELVKRLATDIFEFSSLEPGPHGFSRIILRTRGGPKSQWYTTILVVGASPIGHRRTKRYRGTLPTKVPFWRCQTQAVPAKLSYRTSRVARLLAPVITSAARTNRAYHG
jgi:hypothetical protein